MTNQWIITATRSMKHYASRVAEELARITQTASSDGSGILSAETFADGEMEVVVGSSIRGKEVVLFASCARNEAGLPVSEAKMELYHAVDALKRSQAARIVVFEPFVSCSRSDRTTKRSSVGLWVHFKTLASLGARHIVTYQLHSDKSKSMIDPTVAIIDDIPALNLLKRYLCDVYIRRPEVLASTVRQRWAFCSVDAGGEKLARQFANSLGAPLVVAHKQRDYSAANTVESINILSAEPLAGKTLWIVDDMVDTASSVQTLVRALSAHRPAEVNIIAVHPVFSPPAAERLGALMEQGLLKRVIVTDTVFCPSQTLGKVEVVPSAQLSAQVIRAIQTNNPLGKILDQFDAAAYFRDPAFFHFFKEDE